MNIYFKDKRGVCEIKYKILVGAIFVFIVFLILLLSPFKTESQITNEIEKEIQENPEKELNVLIQVKDKDKVEENLKNLGENVPVSDSNLVAGKLKGKDIENLNNKLYKQQEQTSNFWG